jgi:pyruvate,orthophosphate dikinase
MPEVHERLLDAAALLERDAGDIQDIEFTVESGQLWLLQTRTAKRSPQAAVRAAVAFAEAGAISKEQAVRRLRAEQVRQLPSLQLLPEAQSRPPDAHGEPACPGIANGRVVLDPVEADTRARSGETVILARPNTSPEDLQGVIAAAGVMTEQGGSTSHAAVVCRELGRPCVVGCGTGSVTVLAGERVTLDGGTGRVWRGDLAEDRSDERASEDVRKLIDWGLPLAPLRLLRADEAPAGTIDLNALNDGWRGALRPGAIVRGQVLETDEGIHAALAAGVAAVAVCHRLPAVLACLESQALASAPTLPPGQATLDLDGEFAELTLLQLIALKGRPGIDLLADSLALPIENVLAYCRALSDQGLCTVAGTVLRVTPAGRTRLNTLLAQERARAEPAVVLALYEDFRALNTRLKQIMTAWQLKGDGGVNDHADAAYDADVLERLARLHHDAAPLLQRAAALSARLGGYAARLSRAAARIAAGERSYVARIMADSYHTVWFELHEELIGLVGLTRAQLGNSGA